MNTATMTATPEPDGSRYGIKPPWRIDEKRFWYLLEVLPPCKWRRMSDGESFHISERLSGSIVTWAVRIGSDYFELQDDEHKPHAELVAACRAVTP